MAAAAPGQRVRSATAVEIDRLAGSLLETAQRIARCLTSSSRSWRTSGGGSRWRNRRSSMPSPVSDGRRRPAYTAAQRQEAIRLAAEIGAHKASNSSASGTTRCAAGSTPSSATSNSRRAEPGSASLASGAAGQTLFAQAP